MSDTAKLKISINEVGRGTVSLNDMDISGIATSIELVSKVCELTQIRLTIVAEVDAEIVANLEQITLCKTQPEQKQDGVRLLDGRILNSRPRRALG